jgi:hypothetical protein
LAGRLDGIEKLIDDQTVGGILSKTQMKIIIKEAGNNFLRILTNEFPIFRNR